MSSYFQLLTPRESIIYGKKLKTSGSGIRPGILVKLDTATSGDAVAGETVSKCGGSDTPFGFAFGARSMVYGPTTEVYDVGEVVAVVQGTGLAAMDSGLFTSGSGDWATPDAIMYAATGGLLSASGSVKIARVIRTKGRTTPSGGVGASENVAIVRFNIQP